MLRLCCFSLLALSARCTASALASKGRAQKTKTAFLQSPPPRSLSLASKRQKTRWGRGVGGRVGASAISAAGVGTPSGRVRVSSGVSPISSRRQRSGFSLSGQKVALRTVRAGLVVLCLSALWLSLSPSRIAHAMAVGGSAPVPTGPASRSEIVRNFASWLGLFGITAAFHAAEKAIDNLYPWKLRQFAEEEGPSSPFARLLEDILGFQFTILMTTTACTIFSANMFVGLMSQLFGSTGAAYSSTVLTILTIFFAELIPKAIGVSNPELSARLMVRPINFASSMLKPVSFLFTSLSTLLLKFVGLEISEDEGQDVSEEMLKMMILGARSSGGIQKEEGKMMQSVLRLEDMSCNQIMRPRVDVVAIDKSESLGDLLQLSIDSRCARIPVFQGDIDNIIGIAKLKNVLKYLAAPGNSLNATVEEILEPERDKPFFVYEASAAWDVLQEMRKKRHHMGVVVDEHGGTSGIITMEDLIEEVVGDIYDEDELEDLKDDDAMILWDADQQRYLISGAADLREIDSGLRLCIDEETFSSFASFSGWVCDEAGRIPKEGDYLLVSKYILKVLEADERRVLRLSVEEMSEDEEEENAGDREKEKERQSGGPSLSIGMDDDDDLLFRDREGPWGDREVSSTFA